MSAPSASGLHRKGLRHGVVDHQRHAVRMRHVGHGGDVQHHQAGVAQVSAYTARVLGASRRRKASGSSRRRSWSRCRTCARLTASMRDAAAVQRAGGDHVVARLQQRHQRHRLGGHAAGGGHRGAAALQRGHALFQRRHRRVGQPRVDVAEGLQVEQAGGVVGAVEHEAGGLVDRQRARAGGGVGDLAGVDGQRLGLEAWSIIMAGLQRRQHGAWPRSPVLTPAQCRPPNSRACSIFTQRSITCPARRAGERVGFGLSTPSCCHRHFAPMATALRSAARRRSCGTRRPCRPGTGCPPAVHSRLAQDLRVARVDRHDAVAVLLHVLGGEVAGPVPFGRQADHGDGAAGLQDAAQFGDGVGHGARR
jgi:hypothetical protein